MKRGERVVSTGIDARGPRQAATKGGRMRLRFLVLPFATVALLLLTVQSASADKPFRIPVVVEGPLILSGSCSFDVRLDVVKQTQKIIVFSDGRVTINGNWVTRVTNLSDPSKTIVFESSGPLFYTPNADGTTTVKGTGTNVWYFFANQTAPGAPGAVYLVRGLSTEVVDATGTPITGTFTHHGYIENLCDTLA
jgi:hypothetical protein